MTSGHDLDDGIIGYYRYWIEYALQNKNITIFISISPFDFPAGDPNLLAQIGIYFQLKTDLIPYRSFIIITQMKLFTNFSR